MLISHDVDLTLFIILLLLVKRLQLKFGLWLQQGWLRIWPRWSFDNPLLFNMLEHDY